MRRGITLYEVVLALAIFSGAMAAISQVIATGARAALQARLQSQAILLCESKMGELLGGVIPPQPVSEASFASDPSLEGWTWSLAINTGPRTGLTSVEVSVACRSAGSQVDASFTVARLVRDLTAFTTSTIQTQQQAQSTALEQLQQQSGVGLTR
jgi:general secretion pathway protein I